MLDFGCGNGEFIDEVRKKNPSSVSYGIDNKYKNTNPPYHFICSSFEELPLNNFDFITMWGVLEHLLDPHKMFAQLVKTIKSGGYFVVATVNAEGDTPYWYKPPEHLTYWTFRAFYYLANKLDMEIVYYKEYKMQQFFDVYLNRLLARTPKDEARLIESNLKKTTEMDKIIEIPTNEICVVMKK